MVHLFSCAVRLIRWPTVGTCGGCTSFFLNVVSNLVVACNKKFHRSHMEFEYHVCFDLGFDVFRSLPFCGVCVCVCVFACVRVCVCVCVCGSTGSYFGGAPAVRSITRHVGAWQMACIRNCEMLEQV